MQIQFDTQVAEALSIHEAIFLGWIQHNYDQAPIKTDALESLFAFWNDELLHKVLLRLEKRQIISVRRNQKGYCIFTINPTTFQQQTGLSLEADANLRSSEPLLDDNLKKHLKRFEGTDTLLNKNLSRLLKDQTESLLLYAQQEGLSEAMANQSFDKFLHYVAANPDRFWNSDLVAYWRFWVSNSKDKQQQNQTPGNGKRAAIERSAQTAASNWLKKKSQDPQLYHSPKITHE
ncbi:hypothetical protein CYQ88_07345 [Hydrogenovibrio sp. SC-1]|uniref:hypothetical protein n=1 Tax=Hydrogenovibrio sp. SC-1 TaxID=2065820 RepID=UPI000C7A5E15|nr:hypothetical protein [Hydrogenovibrio sp. SC-1]PLA74187.1 hypothetical protein CYQ88_07345 [Hydrogenovibrio sp. SC-1]